MTDGGSQIFRPDQSQDPWPPLHHEPILTTTSPPRVMKRWGVVAASSQEADNQITQDYVSHLTCMDPVFCTQKCDSIHRGVSVWEEEKKRQIKFSVLLSFFLSVYLPYTYSFHIFFSFCSRDSLPSCGKGLLMNVDEHVGNVWASTTAFSLTDRSSTRLWRLA